MEKGSFKRKKENREIKIINVNNFKFLIVYVVKI